jgi:hypothetical protein
MNSNHSFPRPPDDNARRQRDGDARRAWPRPASRRRGCRDESQAHARTYVADRLVLTVVEDRAAKRAAPDPHRGMLVDPATAQVQSTVEALTGRRVYAVVSGASDNSDASFELFLLED